MLVPCQGQTATKWQIWNLNQSLSDSDFLLMIIGKEKQKLLNPSTIYCDLYCKV